MLDAAPPLLVEAVDQERLVIPPPVVPAEAVQQPVVEGDGVILDRRCRFGVGVVGGEGSAQRMIMLSFDMLGSHVRKSFVYYVVSCVSRNYYNYDEVLFLSARRMPQQLVLEVRSRVGRWAYLGTPPTSRRRCLISFLKIFHSSG